VTIPVVQKCREELETLRLEGREPALVARLSQLVSLLDLTTRLGWTQSGGEIPDAALAFVIGEMEVGAGALYLTCGGRGFERRAARGLPGPAPERIELQQDLTGAERPGGETKPLALAGVAIVCPVQKAGKMIALVGLGPRTDGRTFTPEHLAYLESLMATAATPIEGGLIDDERRQANRDLSVKVYQLQNLFDIGRELAATLDEDAIERLIVTTLMGHFLAARTALYHLRPRGLELGHVRGARPGTLAERLPGEPAWLAQEFAGPRAVAELPECELKARLLAGDFALVVPLVTPGRLEGLIAVGARPGGRPPEQGDLDFAAALARQAQAALEGSRLHQLRIEKERQDRDLEIARRIQVGLLPKAAPLLTGFEIAGESRSCLHVGGDYFDYVPLAAGKLGLVIADVSGKGTPASLMMASVHAWLRALAGSESASRVLERLNRFVYASTETSRYVTLFYGELDPAARRLVYVNAGHVPPFVVRANGPEERLRCGGPVLGLLDEVTLEPGELTLEPGDLLAAVTDGVTEAVDATGREFGDERVRQALATLAGAGAKETLAGLVSTVDAWVGPVGCSDDLTALILKATC